MQYTNVSSNRLETSICIIPEPSAKIGILQGVSKQQDRAKWNESNKWHGHLSFINSRILQWSTVNFINCTLPLQTPRVPIEDLEYPNLLDLNVGTTIARQNLTYVCD